VSGCRCPDPPTDPARRRPAREREDPGIAERKLPDIEALIEHAEAV